MIITQISDTHILARSSDRAVGCLRAETLRPCIADINRQRPDVVVHTGDIVQHGRPEEYAHVRAILAELEVPLFQDFTRDHPLGGDDVCPLADARCGSISDIELG